MSYYHLSVRPFRRTAEGTIEIPVIWREGARAFWPNTGFRAISDGEPLEQAACRVVGDTWGFRGDMPVIVFSWEHMSGSVGHAVIRHCAADLTSVARPAAGDGAEFRWFTEVVARAAGFADGDLDQLLRALTVSGPPTIP
jgi:hypothetical protein